MRPCGNPKTTPCYPAASPRLPPRPPSWLPPVATPRGYSVATPRGYSVAILLGYPVASLRDALRGYSPWLPSVATLWLLRGCSLATLRGYPPWLPSVATPCGYSAGGWRTLGAGAGRGRGLSAGGKRIITRRIASLRTRVGDSGWVPEGSLAGFFARHEPALPLICGGDRALASPRDQQPLKHQSCREPWGIMAQKPQLETSSAT